MDQSVHDAISERIKLGHTKEEVVAEFVAVGYEQTAAEQLYDQVAAPAALPEVAPIPPAVETAVAAPVNEDTVETKAEVSVEALSTSMQSSWNKVLKIILATVAVLVLGGLVAWLVVSDTLTNLLGSSSNGAPYQTEAEMIAGVVAWQKQTKAFGFNTEYSVTLAPLAADTPVLDFSDYEWMDSLDIDMSDVPSAGELHLNLSGLIDVRNMDNPEFDIEGSISVLYEPVLFNAGAAARLADGDFYAKLVDVPTMFERNLKDFPLNEWVFLVNQEDMMRDSGLRPPTLFVPTVSAIQNSTLVADLGGLLGPWAELMLRDQTTVAESVKGVSQLASGLQAYNLDVTPGGEQVKEYAKRLQALVEQYPPITFIGKPVAEEVSGKTIFVYQIEVSHQNLQQLAFATNAEFSEVSTPVSEEEILEHLPTAEQVAAFNRLLDIEVRVYESGALAGIKTESLFGLPDTTTQLATMFALNWTEHNDGVNIEAPTVVHEKTLEQILDNSMSGARSQAVDASIKQSLNNQRPLAEVVYNKENRSYAGVCQSDYINRFLDDLYNLYDNESLSLVIDTKYDSASDEWIIVCNDADKEYAIIAPLVSSPGQSWCVDSTGFSGEVSATALTTATDRRCED
jgi:hypothetical protein